MKTLIEKAVELLKEAETLTHLNLPDDLQSYIDAATKHETTVEFKEALESHKRHLRQTAIKLLDDFLVNEYYLVEQAIVSRPPRVFSLSDFVFDANFDTELATLHVDGKELNVKVTKNGLDILKEPRRAVQFRDFTKTSLQVELPDISVSELDTVYKLFGV